MERSESKSSRGHSLEYSGDSQSSFKSRGYIVYTILDILLCVCLTKMSRIQMNLYSKAKLPKHLRGSLLRHYLIEWSANTWLCFFFVFFVFPFCFFVSFFPRALVDDYKAQPKEFLIIDHKTRRCSPVQFCLWTKC